MPATPFFPAWAGRFFPLPPRLRRAVRAYTLCQLESCLAPWVPADLFPKAAARQNSRDRDYTRWRTFWCMLWQGLNPPHNHFTPPGRGRGGRNGPHLSLAQLDCRGATAAPPRLQSLPLSPIHPLPSPLSASIQGENSPNQRFCT